jgi:hypothetical protein
MEIDMKNAMRVLSLIALTGTALAAASNASFAAPRGHAAHQKPVAAKRVSMKKHKKAAHKKVVINLERDKKGRKARKITRTSKKPSIAGPIVSQN